MCTINVRPFKILYFIFIYFFFGTVNFRSSSFSNGWVGRESWLGMGGWETAVNPGPVGSGAPCLPPLPPNTRPCGLWLTDRARGSKSAGAFSLICCSPSSSRTNGSTTCSTMATTPMPAAVVPVWKREESCSSQIWTLASLMQTSRYIFVKLGSAKTINFSNSFCILSLKALCLSFLFLPCVRNFLPSSERWRRPRSTMTALAGAWAQRTFTLSDERMPWRPWNSTTAFPWMVCTQTGSAS